MSVSACIVKHLSPKSTISAYRADMAEDVADLVAGGMDSQTAWTKVVDEKLVNLQGEVARVETTVAEAYSRTPAGKKTEGKITQDAVRAAVERMGVKVTSLQVRQSNTEPTAILSLERPLTPDEGDKLSKELRQEAIAQRYEDGTGDLFGPKADEWGPFNPEYFLDAEEEVVASGKRVDEYEMSTRTPYAKRGVMEDGKASLLVSDFAATKGQENWINAVADLVTKYPNYRDAKSADTPERQLERLVRQMTDNLLWLHDQVPAATRSRSKLWYDGARAIVDRWVRKYELTPHQAAGLLAVLSPQKDWYMNVSLAERVAQVMNERQSFRWSKQMTETASRIFGGAAYQEDVEAIKGQTLEDLESDYLRAMWLRVYDEAHNSRTFMIVGPEGDVLAEARTKDGSQAKVAWGGISTIAKAVSIFNDGSFDNISKELGRKHKVRNFYNNILVPNSPNGHVTIDTHAVAAALLRALSGNAIEVKHNFGGPSSAQAGLQGSYALYEEAYRRAAEARGLLPREMQSITWEAVRGLFVPTFKSQASKVKAVDGAWEQFKKGRLSYENTRDFVSELAGGIEPPSWLGRDPGAYAEDESAADEGDVSGDGVSERDAEPVDGGAGGRDPGAAAQGLIASAKRVFADSGRTYTPEQLAAFERTGRVVEELSLRERLQILTADWKKKLAQGIFDQFAPIKDLGAPGKAAYALARLSKGSMGAVEALLHHGKLKVTADGAYDADMSGGLVDRLFAPLGGESADFLSWVAANRAERLSAEDRENLFTPADIAALKALDSGKTRFDYTLQHGPNAGRTTRDRTLIYRDALKTFNEYQKNVLDVAEQSGLIDGSTRPYWEHEFYVPFYRQGDDGSFAGVSIKDGLVRQKAFERLKGGKDKLKSDLLENVLQNMAHLVDASAKNRAAVATIDAAQQLSIAYTVPSGTKGSVWIMRNGQAEHYAVEDPYTLAAISSLAYSGLKGFGWDMLTAPKRWLTIGVTASPAFKIRNLIRDSVSAIGVSELSPNILRNRREGWKASDKDSQTYVSALAGGGLIRFGTMLEGRQADRVRQLVKQARRDAHMLDSESKIRKLYDLYLEPAVAAYNELGNRSEEVNRSALYAQLIAKGVSPVQANLAARDLMDFSMMGAWGAVRFLTQVVPFLNARLQGLYKLGRGAAEHKAKFAILLGAVALASITLMAAYSDDDWWKKREDWDRNTNWAFKIGDIVYRIPKPFEIGAIATLAERGLEFAFNPDMTGKRYAKNVRDLVLDNLAMNPVPQAVKPIIDLYANYDSFTGRPIENLSMQRLRPEYRMTANTSITARGVSAAGNAVANTVGGKFLSPVQVDHLIDGYFGWLGSFAMFVPEMILREVTDQPERPARDLYRFATQGIAQEVTSGSSYYVTALYKQAEEIERAYATWRQLQKEGKLEEAGEFFEDYKDQIVRYRSVTKVKDGEAKFNEMIRMIERNRNLDPDEKKARIIKIREMQDRLARTLTAAR